MGPGQSNSIGQHKFDPRLPKSIQLDHKYNTLMGAIVNYLDNVRATGSTIEHT